MDNISSYPKLDGTELHCTTLLAHTRNAYRLLLYVCLFNMLYSDFRRYTEVCAMVFCLSLVLIAVNRYCYNNINMFRMNYDVKHEVFILFFEAENSRLEILEIFVVIVSDIEKVNNKTIVLLMSCVNNFSNISLINTGKQNRTD